MAAERQVAHEALETAVCEYRSTREYERDVRYRRRDGWRVVSVLQRPAPPGGLRGVGVSTGVLRPNTEYLVTYSRAPRPVQPERPLEWLLHPHLPQLPGRRSAPWTWVVIGLLLVALLVYGVLDFFGGPVPF